MAELVPFHYIEIFLKVLKRRLLAHVRDLPFIFLFVLGVSVVEAIALQQQKSVLPTLHRINSL